MSRRSADHKLNGHMTLGHRHIQHMVMASDEASGKGSTLMIGAFNFASIYDVYLFVDLCLYLHFIVSTGYVSGAGRFHVVNAEIYRLLESRFTT